MPGKGDDKKKPAEKKMGDSKAEKPHGDKPASGDKKKGHSDH
eukprot:CAMPEP_0205999080 /NCGR_PEP_ID=MMETSP1464-20131121/633_1 /ASSEMBLY_ACC=CAM_ASM_001124 /TAXON_ID=119497 /ORGANISM="Exanthemachrysis gayraliae, Strain RCC1523" /LENGTH=41 /DNA_ID= /DNA_START= /DNA_END= /DNA_ORIENTATION=